MAVFPRFYGKPAAKALYSERMRDERPDADSAAIFAHVLECNVLNMHAARHVWGVLQADDSTATLQARLSEWLGQVEVVA